MGGRDVEQQEIVTFQGDLLICRVFEEPLKLKAFMDKLIISMIELHAAITV